MLSLSVFSLSFGFLSSASFPVLATQPLFLPFLFLPAFASQWLPRCSLSAFASLVFPVLSNLVSRVFFPGSLYSAYLFVSFRPSRFCSHSCFPGASLMLSLSGFSRSIGFLSSASLPVLATQPLFLPFLFLPVSASQLLPRCSLSALASLVLPILSDSPLSSTFVSDFL